MADPCRTRSYRAGDKIPPSGRTCPAVRPEARRRTGAGSAGALAGRRPPCGDRRRILLVRLGGATSTAVDPVAYGPRMIRWTRRAGALVIAWAAATLWAYGTTRIGVVLATARAA